jgi:hypothetical protein
MFSNETTALARKIVCAGILGAAALAASPASAKWCKGVYVKATNQTGRSVTITDLDYYDYEDGKWRSEPTVNKRIPNGQVWSDTRTLESVGGERIKIRIEYTDAYGSRKTAYSGDRTCRNGSSFSVVMTGPKTAPPSQPVASIPIGQGVYLGRWSNGRKLIEHVRQVSGNAITMQRRGGGQPVLFTLIGANTYRDASGSRIVVTSNSSFFWTNAGGDNRVDYRRVK